MSLTFAADRLAAIRQRPRQTHATLTLRSAAYEAERVYVVYREFIAHDENGKALGRHRRPIEDNDAVLCATVLAVEKVDVTATEDFAWGRALTREDVRDCGYKSITALRADWRERHREDFANLVWFVLGDHRDQDIFMQFGGLGGGDYTRNRHRALDPDAPALTPVQYADLGMKNRQKDIRREADRDGSLLAETEAQRIARIEAAGAEAMRLASSEFALIGQRISPYERRLAEQD